MEQTFGSFVREKRQSIGLSLRTLAAKLDLSPVYLSNIENPQTGADARIFGTVGAGTASEQGGN